jgi:hypothetical protein
MTCGTCAKASPHQCVEVRLSKPLPSTIASSLLREISSAALVLSDINKNSHRPIEKQAPSYTQADREKLVVSISETHVASESALLVGTREPPKAAKNIGSREKFSTLIIHLDPGILEHFSTILGKANNLPTSSRAWFYC